MLLFKVDNKWDMVQKRRSAKIVFVSKIIKQMLKINRRKERNLKRKLITYTLLCMMVMVYLEKKPLKLPMIIFSNISKRECLRLKE